MTWAAAGTLWAKAASFIAQIVLGYLLTKGEWGVYAIAIAVAAFVMTFRDGGVRELLVQRGIDEYNALRGPVFWFALVVNAGLAAVLTLAATAVADFYNQPEVRNLIWVLAAAVLLDTPAQLLRARLRIDLRFAEFARLNVASTTLRYGGTIALAAQGFGAMSFVLPLPFIAIFEWVVLGVVLRENPVRSAPQLSKWRGLAHDVRWILVGTVTNVFATMGDYAVLGRLVPAGVLGTYYFAFQLSVHASMLAAANVNTILMPTLARVADDIERQKRATLRALRALALIASPLSLGFVAVVAPLEALVWKGKWLAAVGAVQVLGVMLPIRLSFMLASSSLKARGLFRRWALLSLAQGVGLMVIASVAGLIFENAWSIALAISVYWLVASPVTLVAALRHLVGLRSLCSALLPAWLIACAVAALSLVVDTAMLSSLPPIARLVVLGAVFFRWVPSSCQAPHPPPPRRYTERTTATDCGDRPPRSPSRAKPGVTPQR